MKIAEINLSKYKNKALNSFTINIFDNFIFSINKH